MMVFALILANVNVLRDMNCLTANARAVPRHVGQVQEPKLVIVTVSVNAFLGTLG
jgi:hypothetical protein